MKDKILFALSHVDDPDLRKDLVTLNMIQDIKVEGNKVTFRLVLTTPACPLKDMIKNACITAIHHFVDKNLEVNIILDSKTTTSQTNQNDALSRIKNIIAVASGKGGVGKSTVAVNLAIALAKLGAKTGLLDADIYGPSLPTMLGLRGAQPQVTKEGEKITIIPFEKYGIKAMSIGSLVEEKQALIWRGPMISTALKQLLRDVDWGDLDYLIIDMPPGTGDIHLTLAQQFPLGAVVMVTTPQLVSLADVHKSMALYMNPAINKPVIGVVENMSWFSPEEHPESKYFLFGKGGGEKIASEYNIPLLAQLPLFQKVAENADEGLPAVLNENPEISKHFIEMAGHIARQIAVLNNASHIAEHTPA
ncbi:MAG: Mrp/NBP35 family ATP-binding protein [Bacteroidetes bacterium]|nr:Mrp/NBP35 family ATP-binding protein [Bacteroidota bacterium]